MQSDSDFRDKLISYISDAYAMERQIEEQLEHQVKETQRFPDIQMRIQEHLDATKQHRERMEQRLDFYQHKPSSVKGAVSSMMGNLAGALSAGRTDKLAKIARDDYMVEHLEIAAYELLIATAQAFGDTDTVRACELNLADEVSMASWLEDNLGKTAIRSLQQDGIAIDDPSVIAANDAARRALRSARLGLPSTDQFQQPSAPMGSV